MWRVLRGKQDLIKQKKSVIRKEKAQEILWIFWMTHGFRCSGPPYSKVKC